MPSCSLHPDESDQPEPLQVKIQYQCGTARAGNTKASYNLTPCAPRAQQDERTLYLHEDL